MQWNWLRGPELTLRAIGEPFEESFWFQIELFWFQVEPFPLYKMADLVSDKRINRNTVCTGTCYTSGLGNPDPGVLQAIQCFWFN
jgi:hypothetical protein